MLNLIVGGVVIFGAFGLILLFIIKSDPAHREKQENSELEALRNLAKNHGSEELSPDRLSSLEAELTDFAGLGALDPSGGFRRNFDSSRRAPVRFGFVMDVNGVHAYVLEKRGVVHQSGGKRQHTVGCWIPSEGWAADGEILVYPTSALTAKAQPDGDGWTVDRDSASGYATFSHRAESATAKALGEIVSRSGVPGFSLHAREGKLLVFIQRRGHFGSSEKELQTLIQVTGNLVSEAYA